MTTVAIIGAGDLGGATAYALAARHVADRVVLIDVAAGVASGKALDIRQAGAIGGSPTRLSGAPDVTHAAGSCLIVIADRAGEAPSEWRGDEGLGLLRRLAPHVGDAPLLFAGSAQADLIALAAREVGLPRERLIGSAPEALASSIAAIIAMEAGCSATEVTLAVLGAPPRDFVVPWTEATIGGYLLDRVLSPVQITRIEARAACLWPPGPYALAAAAARVTEAVICSSRRSMSVLTPLAGEFGARGVAAALPVLLGPHGITRVRVPILSARERVRLETALGA